MSASSRGDARHAARREQREDQLGAVVGGVERDALVGAGEGEHRALEALEPSVRDGEAFAEIRGHRGFTRLHGLDDRLRVGGKLFPRDAGDDLLDRFRHGGGAQLEENAARRERIGQRDGRLGAPGVELVADLADHLLEHVFEREDAGPFAFFIDDQREVADLIELVG